MWVCVFFLRKETEDDEGAEEAAPPCSVFTDGGCRRFSTAQGHTPPSRQASQREETDAHHPPSEHTPPPWPVVFRQWCDLVLGSDGWNLLK